MVKSTDPVPEKGYNDFANKVLNIDGSGNEYTQSNPFPVSSVSHTSTDLEGKGKITIGTTAVELTFTGITENITITSIIENTGIIYIGESDVLTNGSNAGFILYPGVPVSIDYDDTTNPLYAVSDTVSQTIVVGGLK